MVGVGAVGLRLPEVVQERAEEHLEPGADLGSLLDDGEEMLLERARLPCRAQVVADHRSELRKELDERPRVPCEPQGISGTHTEQELRELAHAVRVEPAADPLARDVAQAGRLGAHLRHRVGRDRERELREEPQTAEDPQRVLAEAVPADGVQLAPLAGARGRRRGRRARPSRVAAPSR